MFSVPGFQKHLIISLAELKSYSVSISLKVHFDLSNNSSIKMEEVCSLIVVALHVTNSRNLLFRFPITSFKIYL